MKQDEGGGERRCGGEKGKQSEMVEEWVMERAKGWVVWVHNERVNEGARERRTKGKEWHGEEERRMEGKMNSRWQSDNPGYDRSEYLPVRCRYTHRLHRNALIYRTSAMCRERRAPRAYVSTYIHIHMYECLHKRVCCLRLFANDGTRVLFMNAYTGWRDLTASPLFKESIETKLFLYHLLD